MAFRILLSIVLSIIFMACSGSRSKSEQSFAFSVGTGFSCKADGVLGPKAIYGSDDRLDWVDSPGLTKEYWAKATLALMPLSYLSDQGDQYKVEAESYEKSLNLCEGQKFSEQPSAAFCSGFLVSSDLIVTAGHCIRDLSECQDTQFVFDFAKSEVEQVEYVIKKESVYTCKEIVARSVGDDDFAVIRLNKHVEGRTPINIRRAGSVSVGDGLMIIGHPMGLPSKITEGGAVMSSGNKITASVDAFAANSGSVILNMQTGDAEGLLVAGETDFVFQNGCRVEYHCTSDCRGEVITPINKLSQYIPDIRYQNPACVK